MEAFNLLWVGHFVYFVTFQAFVYLKHIGWYNEAQFLQTSIMPFMYWFPMFYIMWSMKVTTGAFWGDQINEIQGWLLCEVFFLGFSLFNSFLFLVFAYISKMESFMSDSFLIENDDNPWNNKDTEDFLRHLKAEMFTIVYPAAFIAMEGSFGFSYEGVGAYTSYGPHDMMPTKAFFIITLIPRIF